MSRIAFFLYGLPCFSAKREASLLYTTVAMVPMPPVAEKTNGEKEPCSISRTRSSYALFFSTCSSDSTEVGWSFDSKVRMVENADIKQYTRSIPPSKTLCHNVKSGTILSVGNPVLKLLPSYRLYVVGSAWLRRRGRLHSAGPP